MINPHIFRQYDIRGKVPSDLSAATVRAIGQAFGTHIRRNDRTTFVVGHDVRLSSPEFAVALIDGIRSTGCNIINVGQIPTPILYFAANYLESDASVMITGSHNPIEYNGLKLRMNGEPFVGDQIQLIRQMIETNDFIMDDKIGSVNYQDIVDSYLDYVKSKVALEKPLSVVVDAGNGANGAIVPQLFRDLGCSVVEMFCEPDGNFPNHHPDPNEIENIKDLMERVQDVGADIGFAYDGDGDRLGVVDENGKNVLPDRYISLLAKMYLHRSKGAIVFDVRCSQALVETIEDLGGKPVMSACGYPSITQHMREEQGLLGGETTGHIFFNDGLINYDDAIYASCQMLLYLSQSEKRLSEHLEAVPNYYSTPEIRIDCPDDRKFEIIEELRSYFAKQFETIEVDGVRIQFGDGWALIRASNTQPKLSLRFEANSELRLEEIKQLVVGQLAKHALETGSLV